MAKRRERFANARENLLKRAAEPPAETSSLVAMAGKAGSSLRSEMTDHISRLQKETAPCYSHEAVIYVGDDLLSHTLSRAVQSARRGLTSVFGMGTGISPAVKSPASLTWALRPLGSRRGLHAEPVTSMSKELLAIGLGQSTPRWAEALLGMTISKDGRRDADLKVSSTTLISHN